MVLWREREREREAVFHLHVQRCSHKKKTAYHPPFCTPTHKERYLDTLLAWWMAARKQRGRWAKSRLWAAAVVFSLQRWRTKERTGARNSKGVGQERRRRGRFRRDSGLRGIVSEVVERRGDEDQVGGNGERQRERE